MKTSSRQLAGLGKDLPTGKRRLPTDKNPFRVYLSSLSKGSRRTMEASADILTQAASRGQCDTDTFPWESLRYQHTAAIRSWLADNYATATANKILSCLRGILKQAWRLGLMNAEEYHRAVDLKVIRGETLPRGRALSITELKALFDNCASDLTPVGIRDAALLAILYGGGLRRAEVISLDIMDYDISTGALKVRTTKNRKERFVYSTNGASTAIDSWLKVRGSENGPLFCPIRKGGKIEHRRMTSQAVFNICRKRAFNAGIEQFSPHDLRRTFVSDLLDAGADIVSVQKLAGHAKTSTTARYDRRGERAKRKASEMIHVPFRQLH